MLQETQRAVLAQDRDRVPQVMLLTLGCSAPPSLCLLSTWGSCTQLSLLRWDGAGSLRQEQAKSQHNNKTQTS
jgi:hypothetical protein